MKDNRACQTLCLISASVNCKKLKRFEILSTQNIPLQFVKLMVGWDGKNASLLKFNILSDVDGERLRLGSVLAQSQVLNKK